MNRVLPSPTAVPPTGLLRINVSMWRRRITALLMATVAGLAASIFVTGSASATTAIWVSGTVRCVGGDAIEGVWVAASGGGWAGWQVIDKEQYPNGSLAYYWRQVDGPTTVSLHIGCGGSTSSWATKDDTPATGSIDSSIPLNTTCNEAAGAEAVRCTTLTVPSIGNRVADLALLYDGQWGGEACEGAHLGANGYVDGYSGGQCRQFVNCLIYRASWHSYNPTSPNYSFTGAIQISGSSATRGDLIQVGQGIHTAIILQNLGGGTYVVVDSNYESDEIVHVHNWTPPSAGVTYWRYSQASTDQSGPPLP